MNMKSRLLISFVLAFAATNLFAQYSYLGSWNSSGVPNYLELTDDDIDLQLLEDINLSLPERKPVPTYHPEYLTDVNDLDILLSEDADVFVTFVHEGAGWKNSLAFYTYDQNDPPETVGEIGTLTLVFPNFSYQGGGGGMHSGNKVLLGSFTAGTGIGFALITRGWNGGSQTVQNNYYTVYSNPDFNPESSPSLRQHAVTLSDASREQILIGFEDINREWGGCDNDFNDAIFYVSSTPFSAIDIENMPVVANAQVSCNSVPENLQTVDVKLYKSTLTWDSLDDADQYRIRFREWGTDDPWQYRNAAADTFLVLGSITGDELDPATYYEWQVASTCTGVQTSNSVKHVFQTLPYCEMPTGYSASNITSTGARVSWSSVVQADTYLLRYFKDGDSSFEWRNSQGYTYYDIVGLQPNTQYYWSVGSRCDEFDSCMAPYSAHYTFTTDEEGRAKEIDEPICVPRGNYLSFDMTESLIATAGEKSIVLSEDLNGDRSPDLLVGTPYSSTKVSVYYNNEPQGTGFSGPYDFDLGTSYTALSLGEINGDGKQDLIATIGTSNEVRIFKNSGTTFGLWKTLETDLFPSSCVATDLDEDGEAELVITNSATDKTHLYSRKESSLDEEKEEQGSDWKEFMTFYTGEGPNHIVTKDLDGNQKNDLCIVNDLAESVVLVFNGNEADSTSYIKSIYEPGHPPVGVAFHDFNADGLVDMAVITKENPTLTIYQNIGGEDNLMFEEVLEITLESEPIAIQVGHFSEEGLADIVIASKDNASLTLFQAQGQMEIAMSEGVGYSGNGSVKGIVCADFNLDGKDDIAATLVGGGVDIHYSGTEGDGMNVKILDQQSDDIVFYRAQPTFVPETIQWQIGDGISFVDLADGEGVTGCQSENIRISKDEFAFQGTHLRCVVKDSDCGNSHVSEALKLFEAVEDHVFEIFPNPAHNVIQVRYNDHDITTADVILASAKGAIVWQQTFDDLKGELNCSIPLNEISQGVYILQIQSNETTVSERVIKY